MYTSRIVFTQYTSRVVFTQYTSRVVFTQYTSRTEFTQYTSIVVFTQYTSRVVFTQYTSRTVFTERQVNTQAYQPSKTPTGRCPWHFPSQPSREMALTEMPVNPLSSAVRTFFSPSAEFGGGKGYYSAATTPAASDRVPVTAYTQIQMSRETSHFCDYLPYHYSSSQWEGERRVRDVQPIVTVVRDLRCSLRPTITEKGTQTPGTGLPHPSFNHCRS